MTREQAIPRLGVGLYALMLGALCRHVILATAPDEITASVLFIYVAGVVILVSLAITEVIEPTLIMFDALRKFIQRRSILYISDTQTNQSAEQKIATTQSIVEELTEQCPEQEITTTLSTQPLTEVPTKQLVDKNITIVHPVQATSGKQRNQQAKRATTTMNSIILLEGRDKTKLLKIIKNYLTGDVKGKSIAFMILILIKKGYLKKTKAKKTTFTAIRDHFGDTIGSDRGIYKYLEPKLYTQFNEDIELIAIQFEV